MGLTRVREVTLRSPRSHRCWVLIKCTWGLGALTCGDCRKETGAHMAWCWVSGTVYLTQVEVPAVSEGSSSPAWAWPPCWDALSLSSLKCLLPHLSTPCSLPQSLASLFLDHWPLCPVLSAGTTVRPRQVCFLGAEFLFNPSPSHTLPQALTAEALWLSFP